MLNAARITAVALFEARLLLRTWRFWILTVMCFFVSFVFFLQGAMMHYWGSGLSGSLGMVSPAFCLLLQYYVLSCLYALAVVWFAHEFRHRDGAARVSEVVYSRPVSTTELVLGKFLGVMLPVACLTLVLAALTICIQLLPSAFGG